MLASVVTLMLSGSVGSPIYGERGGCGELLG